jgi:hypothetical protein
MIKNSTILTVLFLTIGLTTTSLFAFFSGGSSHGGGGVGYGEGLRTSGLSRIGSTHSGSIMSGASVHGGGWEEFGSGTGNNNRNHGGNENSSVLGGFPPAVLGAGAVMQGSVGGSSYDNDDSDYVGYQAADGDPSIDNYQQSYELHESLLN